MQDVVIVAAARTAIGSFQGALKNVPATALGIAAVKGALKQANIDPSLVEEVYMGHTLQAGCGQSPARQVALGAGCPESTEATTINKVCASGMKAIMLAAQNLQTGQCEIMVAGGMESMSLSPFYFPRGAAFGPQTIQDAVLKDGTMDVTAGISMGNCTEETVRKLNISREEQDDAALESYRRATAAWEAGKFKHEVVPVTIPDPRKGDIIFDKDEEPAKLQAAKVRTLKPAFQKDGGTITAANSSSLNDGASAVVLFTAKKAKELGVKPLAKIISFADAARAPIHFGIAPALAVPLALKRAGLTKDDIALFEINEAFAAVLKGNEKLLGLDPNKVNVNGGGVALGHPLGSSGSRIVVTLTWLLKPGEFGVAGICNGGGGASAIVIQRL